MKLLLVWALAFHATSAMSTLFSLNSNLNWRVLNDVTVFTEWESFKKEHGKRYYTPDEETKRLKIFHANKNMIEEHNERFRNGIYSYSLKLNQFADLLNEEFVAMVNGYKYDKKVRGTAATHHRLDSDVTLPSSMDWRTKGAVTPVKNQGECGSCWAFSSTGSLEGQHYRKTGKLVSLSEQNLVDCSNDFGNDGCEGGLMDNAFKYVKANGGIDTETSYPYQAEDEKCRFNPQDVGATDVGFMDVPEGDEQALKEMVAIHGPVSIGIDASQTSFRFYHSGIYDDPNCSSIYLDHGVLAVGYGANEAGRDFWIVKNSWSPKWGDHGYIKIARNENNVCGVASSASIPLV